MSITMGITMGIIMSITTSSIITFLQDQNETILKDPLLQDAVTEVLVVSIKQEHKKYFHGLRYSI